MSEAKQRLASNVGANVLALAVGTAVGVWQTPFLLHHLTATYGEAAGVGAFGQIGLLRSIVDYALLIAFSFAWTINRFTAMRLGKDDDNGVNTYVSTALFALAGLCVVLLAAALLVTPFLPGLIRPPDGFAADTQRLFVLMLLASCTTSINSPFISIPMARHRFDLINMIRIAGFLIQVAVLAACFTTFVPRIAFLGLAYAIKELFVLVCAVMLAHRLAPFLKTAVGLCAGGALRDMAVMSFWAVIDRIGYLLYFSIDLIVINHLLGNVACGRYTPLTQLAFLLSMASVAITQVFWPIAYEHIARRQGAELVDRARRTTKLMGLLMALPIGLLCGLSAPLLTVWLGPEWAAFAPLLVLLIAPSALNASVRHLFSLTHGLNRVRAPALVTVCGGLLNLGLSVVFIKYTRLGLYGVAAATVASLTLRNMLFLPLYCAAILNRSRSTFYSGILPGFMTSLILTVCGLGLTHLIGSPSLWRLAGAGVVLAMVYAALCAVLLNKHEKRFVVSLIWRPQP